MKVRFLALAQKELDDAVSWYNEQSEDLGKEFLDELDRGVRLLRICIANHVIGPSARGEVVSQGLNVASTVLLAGSRMEIESSTRLVT